MYNVLFYKQNNNGEIELSNDSNVKTIRKGDNLFRDTSFTTWDCPLNYLESGVSMFYNSSITKWDMELPNLIIGDNMFTYSDITQFNSSFPLLQSAIKMFGNTNLLTFSQDMPNLEVAEYMFQNAKLTTFSGFIKNLKNGKGMFKGCSELSTFVGNLESLEDGTEMFSSCKLSPSSVRMIYNTLHQYKKSQASLHRIDIGLDCSDTFDSITEYAQKVGYKTWLDMVTSFEAKGWTVNWYSKGKMIESDKVNITRSFDLSDYNDKIICEQEVTLTGYFTINIQGIKDSNCKTSISFHEVTLNGVALQGMEEIIKYIYFDKEGQIITKEEFDLLFTSITEDSMYLAQAKFSILGFVGNLMVATNGITVEISDSFTYVNYDKKSNVIGYGLKNLEDGTELFKYQYDLTVMDGNLSNIKTGTKMFYNCTALQSLGDCTLDNLVTGSSMFYNCSNLSQLPNEFPSLVVANSMFYNCDGISRLPATNVTREETVSREEVNENGQTVTITQTVEVTQEIPPYLSFPKVSGVFHMFYNSSIGSTAINVPNLVDGDHMFYYSGISSLNGDFSSLKNGDYMFYSSTLNNVNVQFPNLESGYGMFAIYFWSRTSWAKLTNWDKDLPKLTTGYRMFDSQSKLRQFSGNLDNLKTGNSMFYYTALSSWNTNMPSLQTSSKMFYASNLTSFEGNIDNLTNADDMFNYCSKLTSFKSDLISLTSGKNMFAYSKLDKESILHIVNVLKTKNTLNTSAYITFGVDKSLQWDEEVREALGIVPNSSQPGEKYSTEPRPYASSSFTNKAGGKWNVTTYWNA